MHYLSANPMVRIVFALIAGILLQFWLAPAFNTLAVAWTISFLLFAASFLIIKRKRLPVTGLSFLLWIALTGSWLTYSDMQWQAVHPEASGFIISIQSMPRQAGKMVRYQAKIEAERVEGKWKQVNTGCWLYLDDADSAIINDRLITRIKPELIRSPTNPGQFDFKRYSRIKGIVYQLFISDEHHFSWIPAEKKSLSTYAQALQGQLVKRLHVHITDPRQRAITAALIAGDRSLLSNDLKEQFVNAGVVHVLAVSGLHVGIIYLIFSFLLKPLRSYRLGRHAYTLIILVSIWGFALVTGLSPSVTRAAFMFSMFLIGQGIYRQGISFNVLAATAFVLLFVKPLWIFEVGFQLSFAAVWGILAFQPSLEKLLAFKASAVHNLWRLATVSLAAQLGTLPFVWFYFQQFPLYFLPANVIIVPLIFILMFFLLAVVSMGQIMIIGKMIGFCAKILVGVIVYITSFFSSLPGAVIELPVLPVSSFVLSLILLLLWLRFLTKRNFSSFLALGLISSACITTCLFSWYRIGTTSEWVIFDRSSFLLGIRNGTDFQFVSTEPMIPEEDYLASAYMKAHDLGFLRRRSVTCLVEATRWSKDRYLEMNLNQNIKIIATRESNRISQPAEVVWLSTNSCPPPEKLKAIRADAILLSCYLEDANQVPSFPEKQICVYSMARCGAFIKTY